MAVCDGCERIFHLDCAGMKVQQAVMSFLDECICLECVRNAAKCNRWPLGFKFKDPGKKRGVVDGDDFADSRKQTQGDNSFGGDRFGIPVTYSDFLHGGKGINLKEASGILTHCGKLDLEDILQHKKTVCNIFGEVDLCSRSEPLWSESHPDTILMAHNLEEMHLGLTSNNINVGKKRSNEPASPDTGSLSCKRRKPARLSETPSAAETKEVLLMSSCKERSLCSQTVGRGSWSKQLDDTLPIQFEDLILLCLGNIDARPSYHNVNNIWHVGYRSCWHDKVTASLFTCEVSDGGDSGPLFIVRRRACSVLPIPHASTILCRTNLSQSHYQNERKNDIMASINSDPHREHDILSCIGSCISECPAVQTSNGLQPEASASCERSENPLSDNLVSRDDIGDFLVEASSPSAAWRMVSKKLVEICHGIYKQKGSLRFFCEHAKDGTRSSDLDVMHGSSKDQFVSSSRFHGSLNNPKIPRAIPGDVELHSCSELLMNWLDHDRFGLDMECVHEIVEQLPGAEACSRYVFCKDRALPSSCLMVGNGQLQIKRKSVVVANGEETLTALSIGCKRPSKEMIEDPVIENCSFHLGKPISSRLPHQCVGDILQVQEFLWRFHKVLGLEDPFSYEELEDELIHPHSFIQSETTEMKEATTSRLASFTYSGCMGCALTKVHKSLLSVLISELMSKVASPVDPSSDTGDLKPKRGHKKDADSWITGKETSLNILPFNELTWPELIRRYILAFLSINGNVGSMENTFHESAEVFRCLQGDGGILCGSLTGVAGIETDAQLLSRATDQIFGSLKRDRNILSLDKAGSDGDSSCKGAPVSYDYVPEWAKVLEPVRKLATNVGSRIRNCIYEALEKGPPEWAENILKHSISKDVYKGNASGKTKRAVVSLLDDLYDEIKLQKPKMERNRKTFALISDVIMKKCRIVLRLTAAADDSRAFCNLLGSKLINSSDNNEGILGYPAMLSRPLDFRTIDLRLLHGAYGVSHEAFLEDVRELWINLRIAHMDQPTLVQLAEKLSSNFESLYEMEVVTLFQRLVEYTMSESSSPESQKEIEELLSAREIPKAPWEEGICKVCGIDKDDNYVLLCDKCDAEYHTYCLNPPLARIPEGNWYCPSCAPDKPLVPDEPESAHEILEHLKKGQGEVARSNLDLLSLATALEGRDYWELNVDERILLLKYLSDESLNSVLVHQHLEQSMALSTDLQQKLRSLSAEWKKLKYKEEILAARALKVGRSSRLAIRDVHRGEGIASASRTSDQPNSIDVLSDDILQPKGCQDSILSNEIEHNVVGNNPTLPSSEGVQGLGSYLDTRSSLADVHVPLSDVDTPQSDDLELTTVRNEIVLLQNSIATIERQLLKLSVRREFLGYDSVGKLYWGVAESRTHRRIIAIGDVEFPDRARMAHDTCQEEHISVRPNCSTWVSYNSDTEIKELVACLRKKDPRERELGESILSWQNLRFQGSQQTENHLGEHHRGHSRSSSKSSASNCLITKATTLLETKYGPCSQLDTAEYLKKRSKKGKAICEQKMYRCECLEPILPSAQHCLSCHKTFTDIEFEGHNDSTCCVIPSVSEKSKERSDVLTGKSTNPSSTQRKCTDEVSTVGSSKTECPFNLEDICAKFLIDNSNKELAKEIGLIGSRGVPSFLLSTPPSISDPALELVPPQEVGVQPDKHRAEEVAINTGRDGGAFEHSSKCSLPDASGNKADVNCLEQKEKKSSLNSCAPALVTKDEICFIVPGSSLRSLQGKAFHILNQLKINLLDMEATLPEGGRRASKASSERRRAWRAFIKSAQTIFEMVQAMIVLEDMIKSEYLRNTWWYWSSLSAAAKISTLSSLALRIYSLDAAIDYEKISVYPGRKPDKKQVRNSDPTKVCKKPNKKRKEPEA